MEMYYRRRSKKAHQPTMAMEQCHQKEVVHGSAAVPPSPPSHRCTLLLQEKHLCDRDESQMQLGHIKPGFLFEIDHAQLPPRTPVQLRSIRVAMVCEKTEMNVAVRFPSMESLRAFFNYSTRVTHPALDKKFMMGSALAAKVLVRLVPEEIFAAQRHLLGFWLISSDKDNVFVAEKKGSCLSDALKGNGMVRWGIRRQVKYLGRHNLGDGNAQNSSSSFVDGVEGSEMELEGDFDERDMFMDEEGGGGGDDGGLDGMVGGGGERDEDMEEKDMREDEEEDDEEEEEEEEEEEREKMKKESNKNLKRKRYSFRNLGAKRRKKEKKLELKRKQKQTQKTKKKGKMRSKEELIQRDPKDRWSSERYKLAEQNLLEVMKSKGATVEKPILRPQLRSEARKRIGDTGLLDHLLKHMAGKLAPGNQERFRRRHNPDGAMEYWLESADLVNIRKEAGVTDPYWVPPPGWKPGDSPTQDPICARELKFLKDDISAIKRDLELMATKIQLQEEVTRLRREVNEISTKKRQEENEAITIGPNRCDINQKLHQLVTSLESSKCDFGESTVTVEKYKEQLMTISDFVKEMEEKLGKLAPGYAVERARTGSSFTVPEFTHTKEKSRDVQQLGREARSKEKEVQPLKAAAADERERETLQPSKDNGYEKNMNSSRMQNHEEEKAAKIQRLKSGFRICKPQGTFLWPNMVKDKNTNNNTMISASPQVFVQVEVPTPPSVSSSTTAAPQLLIPSQHNHHQPAVMKPLAEKRGVTVTVSTLPKAPSHDSPLVDLNDVPPPILSAMQMQGWERGGCCCDSSATSSQVGNWLALSSTLKSASDDQSSHG